MTCKQKSLTVSSEIFLATLWSSCDIMDISCHWWLKPWKAYGKMTFSTRIPVRQGGLCLSQPIGTAQSFPFFESFASNLKMLRFLSHISKSSLKHFQRLKLAEFFKLTFMEASENMELNLKREKWSCKKSIEWPPFHLLITCYYFF